MCSCGEFFETRKKAKKQTTQCPTCQERARGMHSSPIYNVWTVNYNKSWPDFFDFYREVGEPPGPAYMLTGEIPGTKASPGNTRWVERSYTLGPMTLESITPYDEMLFDDDLRKLHASAFHINHEDPSSQVTLLEHLEQDFVAAREEDSEEWQLKLEKMAQEYSAEIKKHADTQSALKGRASQTRIGHAFKNKLVPILALRLEEQHKTALHRAAGRHHHVVQPIMEELDYLTAAHITVTVVLDNLGAGNKSTCPISQLYDEIGTRLDHQAFLNVVKREDPKSYERIDRLILRSTTSGYSKKIRRAQSSVNEDISYHFLGVQERAHLGDWAFSCFQSITLWFDTLKWYTGTGKKTKMTYFLSLSVEGLKYRDLIQQAADSASYEAWPMVHKPLEWVFEDDKPSLRGGYLKAHPGKYSSLIRANKGTVPSQQALDSLHNMQDQPFRVNRFIYETMKGLLGKSVEIGKFRTFERDSWDNVNDPRSRIDPSVWDQKYDDNRNELPAHRDARRLLVEWHTNREIAKKERVAPFRVLMVAARFLEVERFYLPCYFDSRLRMYYMVDTLNPQGCDYQKALLQFADGCKVTDDNRHKVESDLLITIANNWAQKENGVKTDKLSLKGRCEFGRDFLRELEVVARDPLCSAARAIWETADEPFEFLAAVREYFEIFVWKTSDTARVPNGRDATNSGSQILGAMLRDPKTCLFTNVTPTEEPMDLYGEVAKEAGAYLRNENWVDQEVKKCRKRAEKKMKDKQKDGAINYVIDGTQLVFTLDPTIVDRKVTKRASMISAYGGSWKSKNGHISDELDELGESLDLNVSLTDKAVVTNAVISGQAAAFPKMEECNKWFKSIAKACLDQGLEYVTWFTPNGSKIVQEYREPLMKQVTTYAMGGGAYWQPVETRAEGANKKGQARSQISFRVGWGDVKESKSQTALGANWTHSHDACIMHDSLHDWDQPFFAVHDCFYGPAGTMDDLCKRARNAFHGVVTFDCFESAVETNGVPLDVPYKGKADVDSCLNSLYMFS